MAYFSVNLSDPTPVPVAEIPPVWGEIAVPGVAKHDRVLRAEFDWPSQSLTVHYETLVNGNVSPLGRATVGFKEVLEANPDVAPGVLAFLTGLVYRGYLEGTTHVEPEATGVDDPVAG